MCHNASKVTFKITSAEQMCQSRKKPFERELYDMNMLLITAKWKQTKLTKYDASQKSSYVIVTLFEEKCAFKWTGMIKCLKMTPRKHQYLQHFITQYLVKRH